MIEQDEISGTMYSDETKLRQILTNFLSNGFKNTEKGTGYSADHSRNR
ncbi:MAG: hypothetical protein CM15mP120_16420 [Pseudomonadota bacterium]|nr:MAG: hypothetical protein CM15mP120_16420 [Pseudomonadota bacterium]